MERYGFWNFVLDFFLSCVTGGLWVFWIIFREIRKSNRANRQYR